MILIRILCARPRYPYQPSQEVEVDDAVAREFLQAGDAEEIVAPIRELEPPPKRWNKFEKRR